MKKVFALVLALAMMLVLVLAVPASADTSVALTADGPDQGYALDVGTIDITDDGADVTIDITITDSDWILLEAHADVQDTAAQIPQTKNGNPKVGKFAQADEWLIEDAQTSAQFVFAAVNGGADGTVAIAVHCVVAHQVEILVDDEPVLVWETETAWIDGTQFAGKDWGMYLAYVLLVD